MRRTSLKIGLVALCLVFIGALAEGDEQATKLLSPYQSTFLKPLHTIDQVFSVTSFDKGKQVGTWKGRIVVDFEKRHAAVITFETKKKEEPSEGLIVIGDRTYQVRYGGRADPEFKEAPTHRDSIAKIVSNEAFKRFMSIDPAKARYDGQVKYGNLLAGEQVTAVLTADKPTEMRLVFDQKGRLLGHVREMSEAGTRHLQITLLEEPVGPDEYVKFGNSRIYQYDHETATSTLLAVRRVERVIVDQPVDAALFKVTMKKKEN